MAHKAVRSLNILQAIDENNVSKADFTTQRARGAYIAATYRPEVSLSFAFASQTTDPTSADAKFLNKQIMKCIESPKEGINYVHLNPDEVRVAVFVDASFANNSDFSSQIGFIMVLMDDQEYANIIHYGSTSQNGSLEAFWQLNVLRWSMVSTFQPR